MTIKNCFAKCPPAATVAGISIVAKLKRKSSLPFAAFILCSYISCQLQSSDDSPDVCCRLIAAAGGGDAGLQDNRIFGEVDFW